MNIEINLRDMLRGLDGQCWCCDTDQDSAVPALVCADTDCPNKTPNHCAVCHGTELELSDAGAALIAFLERHGFKRG